MEMRLATPTRLYLPEDNETVRSFLTFRDRAVEYDCKRLRDNYWLRTQDPERYAQQLEELKSQIKRCLVYEDEEGRPYTYSGLAQELNQRFHWDLPVRLPWPEISPIPTQRALFEPFYYQAEAVQALLQAGHGAIELPTGSGKSLIVDLLLKALPVKALIVAPFSAITEQLYDELVSIFGRKYVGQYGDGKKEFDKRFTVATAQALTKLVPGDLVYETLLNCEMFIFDEAHFCPADSFEKVCTGVGGKAVFRFFTSATQRRNDGSEMLLKGITGPIVYRKTFRELDREGYLAHPNFKVMRVQARNGGYQDPKRETRYQLYTNPDVNQLAGEIASKSVTLARRPTLVLVEQFDQFVQLQNFITVPFEFVHGGATKEVKKILPERYWQCDAKASVRRFNEGKVPLLVGTSAITTGVDTKVAASIINLQGGTSDIKFSQGVGRGTRLKGIPGKKDLWVFDFRIVGSKTMERHIDARMEVMRDMSDDVVEIT
jgi:superfamily II DNA or RNA helicase